MANELLVEELQRQLLGNTPSATGPSSPFPRFGPPPTPSGPFSTIPQSPITTGNPTGSLGSILSKTKGLNSVQSGPLGVLNKGGIAGGLAKGGAGLGLSIAGNLAGEALGGNESPLGRFAQGAGTGGGLGMLLGPKGAVIGGLIGGLGSMVFGGKKSKTTDPNEILTSALSESGLDPQTQKEIRAFYIVTSRLGGDSKDSQIAALNQTGQLILQEMQRRQEAQAEQQFLGNVQGDISQFIEPFRQQTLMDAALQSQIMQQLAPTLPPEYRSVITAGALGQQAASGRLANSLAVSAQMSPVIQAQRRQMQLVDQAAQQLVGQGISTALGGGSTSTLSLQSLLGQG